MRERYRSDDRWLAVAGSRVLRGLVVVVGVAPGDPDPIGLLGVPRPVQEVSHHAALSFDLDRAAAGERVPLGGQDVADFLSDLNPIQHTRRVHSGRHVHGISPDVVLRLPGADNTRDHLQGKQALLPLSLLRGSPAALTLSLFFSPRSWGSADETGSREDCRLSISEIKRSQVTAIGGHSVKDH